MIRDNFETLYLLHREIESVYRPLPWPVSVKEVVVLTNVAGGEGDIVAAAKVINLMQRIFPDLQFDWLLNTCKEIPQHLYSFENSEHVHIRYLGDAPPSLNSVQMLLVGPSRDSYGLSWIQKYMRRPFKGALFRFIEIGSGRTALYPTDCYNKSSKEEYAEIHPKLFYASHEEEASCLDGLSMGLHPGSGVFLDEELKGAPLSRSYCCPSYLNKIEDEFLRHTLLETMGVVDAAAESNYDQYSFNFGYAHYLSAKKTFLDCVALHEKEKHVVVAMTGREIGHSPTIHKVEKEIFTSERLAFFKRKGFGSIAFSGLDEKGELYKICVADGEGRQLRLIWCPPMQKKDMHCLQLAAERILATGDNSAVESWCARCKLYMYEKFGHKTGFFDSQVALANTVDSNLGKFLSLFDEGNLVGIEELLEETNLEDATLRFCTTVTQKASFDQVLEGALKRAAWHTILPELASTEADALPEEFKTNLMEQLKNNRLHESPPILVSTQKLAERVQEVCLASLDETFTCAIC